MSKLVDMGQGLIDSPSAPGYYRVAASFDEVMAECGGLSPLALGLKQQVAATAQDVTIEKANNLLNR